MTLRDFQPGDEISQVAVYNAAANALPGFKVARVEEVQKRTRSRNFDPATRVYAVENGEVVGYCVLDVEHGRISFPWCKRGHASAAAPLFDAMLALARERGLTTLFAAYRRDWQPVLAFFESQGFAKIRDMVNFAVDVLDMPTMSMGATSLLTPLERSDMPAVAEMGLGILRLPPEKLEAYFFANPYFPVECVNVLRSKDNSTPLAMCIAIERDIYADAMKIDSLAPCFRLGAFGTEGLNVKRVNGLFSFLVSRPETALSVGLSLLNEARESMTEGSVNAVAAQAPSDAAHLMGFYNRYFKEQGRFPIYERVL